MMQQVRRAGVAGWIVLGMLGVCGRMSLAQGASPVPKLDLDKSMGVWHEVARMPAKVEKHCTSDANVLTALGSKNGTFQVGIFCAIKGNNSDEWDARAKMDKQGDGKLKITHIWPFRHTYLVLAVGSNYEWATVGTANHKSFWILSRSVTMAPATLAAVEAQAAAQGFDTAKLITLPQYR